jgi:CHASE1-domain containing sensor protein
VQRLLTRIYGERPGPGASRLERLRFVRRSAYYANSWALVLGLVWIVIGISSPGNWILCLGLGGVWLSGLVSITLRIRREEAREQGPGSRS